MDWLRRLEECTTDFENGLLAAAGMVWSAIGILAAGMYTAAYFSFP